MYILPIRGDVNKFGDTSVNVSQNDTTMKDNEKNLKRNVEGGIGKCNGRENKKVCTSR
jgi:hypothetical protein